MRAPPHEQNSLSLLCIMAHTEHIFKKKEEESSFSTILTSQLKIYLSEIRMLVFIRGPYEGMTRGARLTRFGPRKWSSRLSTYIFHSSYSRPKALILPSTWISFSHSQNTKKKLNEWRMNEWKKMILPSIRRWPLPCRSRLWCTRNWCRV